MTKTLRSLFPLMALIFLIGGVASAATQPRPEYPRPELVRADWLNLNGEWDFALDLPDTGEERGLPRGSGFDRRSSFRSLRRARSPASASRIS